MNRCVDIRRNRPRTLLSYNWDNTWSNVFEKIVGWNDPMHDWCFSLERWMWRE